LGTVKVQGGGKYGEVKSRPLEFERENAMFGRKLHKKKATTTTTPHYKKKKKIMTKQVGGLTRRE